MDERAHTTTTHVGDFLVIMLVGVVLLYIAEVVQSKDTKTLQKDCGNGSVNFLSSMQGVYYK